jgi:predicted metalloprotease
MRWTPGRVSSDIEDRRGGRFGGFGRLGIGGFLILLILSAVFHRDFFSLLGAGDDQAALSPSAESGPVATTPAEDTLVLFMSFVLDDAQQTWDSLLTQRGVPYTHARMVLFRDAVQSGCGVAQSAMGPFYCPTDGRIYLDLGFFNELKRRFGAPGDFAEAYVVAHELGHHIQELVGTEQQVRQAQQQNPADANALSVRLELQADCYAGVWGHSTKQRDLLDPGDVNEGLAAAAAVGDDRIQQSAGEGVHPESFTHGTAAERAHWLQRGLRSGNPADCDTFSGPID